LAFRVNSPPPTSVVWGGGGQTIIQACRKRGGKRRARTGKNFRNVGEEAGRAERQGGGVLKIRTTTGERLRIFLMKRNCTTRRRNQLDISASLMRISKECRPKGQNMSGKIKKRERLKKEGATGKYVCKILKCEEVAPSCEFSGNANKRRINKSIGKRWGGGTKGKRHH